MFFSMTSDVSCKILRTKTLPCDAPKSSRNRAAALPTKVRPHLCSSRVRSDEATLTSSGACCLHSCNQRPRELELCDEKQGLDASSSGQLPDLRKCPSLRHDHLRLPDTTMVFLLTPQHISRHHSH